MVCESFVSLVTFISKYFIDFDVRLFLFQIVYCVHTEMQLLFMLMFFILKPYWIHLLFLTGCVCVCVCICVVFRFSMYNILSPSTRESFLLPTKLDAFYLFSLIALARTFSAILSRSSGSGPPCLVPDHRRKAFKHSPLSMMLAVLACYM